MADLKDFNKPDGSSNYITETIDTVKGNISRIAVRDPNDSKNIPQGFKFLQCENNNLQIFERRRSANKLLFDCSGILDQNFRDYTNQVYSIPQFQYENPRDFTPFVNEGFNPGTVITTRYDEITLTVTRAGWVDFHLIPTGIPFLPFKYFTKFLSAKWRTKTEDPEEVSIQGTALQSRKIGPEQYNLGYIIAYKDTTPLTEPIVVVEENMDGSKTPIMNQRLYKYNLFPYFNNDYPIMQTPYIVGLPYKNKDFIDSSYIGYTCEYDLPIFGLDSTPFDNRRNQKFGPVYIRTGLGAISTALSCDDEKSNANYLGTRSYDYKMYKITTVREYLTPGQISIKIPRKDQLFRACVGQPFPSIGPMKGDVKYNPWIHGGLPGSRGAVIIEPLMMQGDK